MFLLGSCGDLYVPTLASASLSTCIASVTLGLKMYENAITGAFPRISMNVSNTLVMLVTPY